MIINEKDIKSVFSKILKVKPEKISDKLSMNTHSKWDSLNHLKIIVALEGKFKISFKEKDVATITSFKLIKSNIKKLGHKIL